MSGPAPDYMREALALARQGVALASPNPMVGCVIVRDGAVVGGGFHTWEGLKHAEILALEQARKFTESSGVTGIVLTKLDGTAKGGVIVAIARELGLPIRFIGVGEKVDDLLPFDPEKFIDSLFAV